MPFYAIFMPFYAIFRVIVGVISRTIVGVIVWVKLAVHRWVLEAGYCYHLHGRGAWLARIANSLHYLNGDFLHLPSRNSFYNGSIYQCIVIVSNFIFFIL